MVVIFEQGERTDAAKGLIKFTGDPSLDKIASDINFELNFTTYNVSEPDITSDYYQRVEKHQKEIFAQTRILKSKGNWTASD